MEDKREKRYGTAYVPKAVKKAQRVNVGGKVEKVNFWRGMRRTFKT